ncbi:MAG TPA: SBBP repeat-containing protein [Blastocatellia bacterium]|nr:SBBP repeat-containing protein [Blastocatellia bacterium]
MRTLYTTVATLLILTAPGSVPGAGHKVEKGRRSHAVVPSPNPSPLARVAGATSGFGGRGFEQNQGQFDRSVRYVARLRDYIVVLSDREVSLLSSRATATHAKGVASNPRTTVTHASAASDEGVVVHERLRFPGASAVVSIEPEDKSSVVSNYFLGSDPAAWRRSVPSYASVVYRNLYPGVDLRFHVTGGSLEYDFVVNPGGDPTAITIQHSGDISLLEPDTIAVGTDGGATWKHRLCVYQDIGRDRRTVSACYVAKGAGAVSIDVPAFDRTLPLVIDPTVTLQYSTFLGGSSYDFVIGVTADADGFCYVTGLTLSPDFPASGTLGQLNRGVYDGFVAKLQPDGKSLVFADYFGGRKTDKGIGIGIDPSGDIVVGGITFSPDFPTVNALQSTAGGGLDSFLLRLNSSGNALVYSTYVGGAQADGLTGIAVDSTGAVVLTGGTSSTNFPIANPLLGIQSGGRCFDDSCADTFVTKVDGHATAYAFSTFLGGTGYDLALSVAVDPMDQIVVAGYTQSTDFPTVAPLIGTLKGKGDGFVTKLSPDGRRILASTYLGGSDNDLANGVDTDAAGYVYVTGNLSSTDFPLAQPIQASYGGGNSDAYLAKLDPNLSQLVYSTYIGGEGFDVSYGVSVDVTNSAYIMGFTSSREFPVANAIQPVYGGGDDDVFVSKFTPAGDAFVYSTYVGGVNPEDTVSGVGIYVDFSGNVFIGGEVYSQNFPVTPGAFQDRRNGGDDTNDGFVLKIVDQYNLSWDPPDVASADPSPPPRFFVAQRAADSSRPVVTEAPGGPAGIARRAELTGYKLYRGNTPTIQITPGNMFTSVPPTQTSTGPTVTGGSYFAVTACYADGSESDPSNPASGGRGEAQISSVVLRGSKVVVTGMRFTDQVTVLFDGIPCASTAKVTKGGTMVSQKGALLTGQAISAYLATHPTTLIAFVNANGGVATFVFRRS